MATAGDLAKKIEELFHDILERSRPEGASLQTFEEAGLADRGRGLLMGLAGDVYVLVDITVARMPPWEAN